MLEWVPTNFGMQTERKNYAQNYNPIIFLNLAMLDVQPHHLLQPETNTFTRKSTKNI